MRGLTTYTFSIYNSFTKTKTLYSLQTTPLLPLIPILPISSTPQPLTLKQKEKHIKRRVREKTQSCKIAGHGTDWVNIRPKYRDYQRTQKKTFEHIPTLISGHRTTSKDHTALSADRPNDEKQTHLCAGSAVHAHTANNL